MTSWGRGMGDAVRGQGRGDATTATAEQRIMPGGFPPREGGEQRGGGGQERGAGGGRDGRRGPALHCSRAAAGKRDARPGETQAEKETGLGARA